RFFAILVFCLLLAFVIGENDLRVAEVDPGGFERAMILTENANFSRGAASVFPCASRRLVSFHHCSTDHAALRTELLLQLFFQTLHLLAEITCFIEIPVPFVFVPGCPRMTLRSFLFCELDGDLLLLALAQNRERYVRAVRKRLQELSQLTRFDQNLVVQHFENIVLLNARSRGRAIGYNVLDD